MAHKPNDLSRQIVKNMAKFLTKKDIGRYIGIDYKTLIKHYEEELKAGIELYIKLGQTAVEMALVDKNERMVRYLMDRMYGACVEEPTLADDNAEDEDNQVHEIQITTVTKAVNEE